MPYDFALVICGIALLALVVFAIAKKLGIIGDDYD